MPVTLESRIRLMQVFNLEHAAYCAAGACACSDITTTVLAENPRTGERAPKQVTKKAPSSLTLLALEKREGLRDTVLAVPDVRAALDRGLLRIVAQIPATAAMSAPATAATPEAPTPAVATPSASSPARVRVEKEK